MKFNVGDKVRVIETTFGDPCEIGDIGTVLTKDEVPQIQFDGFTWYMSETELELLEEPNTNIGTQEVIFAKINPESNAVIPSKRDEDAGYDIYPCFDEDYIEIQPHQTIMIPTGIASAFDKKYYFQLFERGSTGSKGIGQRCGVLDSGYRNEWFVPITNHNDDKVVVILKESINLDFEWNEDCVIIYPYHKAICQAVLIEVPQVEIIEKTYKELLELKSERGTGMLGSSGK